MGDEPPGWSSVNPTQKHSTKGLTVSTCLSGRPTSWLKNNPEILMDNMQLALDINGWPGSMAGQTSSSRISSPFLVENTTSQKTSITYKYLLLIISSQLFKVSSSSFLLEKTHKLISSFCWHFQFQSHCFYFGPRNSWLLHFLCVPHAASGGRGLAAAARGGCDNVTLPVGGRMLVLMTDVSSSPKIISMEGNHVWV